MEDPARKIHTFGYTIYNKFQENKNFHLNSYVPMLVNSFERNFYIIYQNAKCVFNSYRPRSLPSEYTHKACV